MSDGREELIQGLRDFATFLEQRPNLATPHGGYFDIWTLTKEDFVQMTREMGDASKRVGSGWFCMARKFGPIRLELNVPREQVCRRVVMGTRWVEEVHVPGHDEDVVDWQCDEPILKEVE